MSVDRAEISRLSAKARGLLRRGPLVPDAHPFGLQRLDARLPAEKPEKLDDDRAKVDLLRREEWKALAKIEAHLVTEDPARPRAGAVCTVFSLFQGATKQIEIRLHGLVF
jgi:hypothetical protein